MSSRVSLLSLLSAMVVQGWWWLGTEQGVGRGLGELPAQNQGSYYQDVGTCSLIDGENMNTRVGRTFFLLSCSLIDGL
jgi:hypothetical protein